MDEAEETAVEAPTEADSPEDGLLEPTILDTESTDPEELLQNIFRQGAPQAAQVIVDTATDQDLKTADKIRLDAARYVVDRVLGRITGLSPMGAEDPYERFARRVTQEAEAEADADAG